MCSSAAHFQPPQSGSEMNFDSDMTHCSVTAPGLPVKEQNAAFKAEAEKLIQLANGMGLNRFQAQAKDLYTVRKKRPTTAKALLFDLVSEVMAKSAERSQLRTAPARLADVRRLFSGLYKALANPPAFQKEVFATDLDTEAAQYFREFSAAKCHGRTDLFPAQSTGNGKCLFNSLSTALYGSEEHSTMLRVRAILEVAHNEGYYRRHAKNVAIYVAGASFEMELEDLSDSNSWAGQSLMPAIAQALKVNLRVAEARSFSQLEAPKEFREREYTPVAGRVAKTVCVLFVPSGQYVPRSAAGGSHFVPLLRRRENAEQAHEAFVEPCALPVEAVEAGVSCEAGISGADFSHILKLCREALKEDEGQKKC